MRLIGRAAALAVAGVLLLGGCGQSPEPAGGDPGSPTTPPPAEGDPGAATAPPLAGSGGTDASPACALLTEVEVTGVVGSQVTGTGTPERPLSDAACVWSFQSEIEGEVTVDLWIGLEHYEPSMAFDEEDEIEGIGERAHASPASGLCSALFLRGDQVVLVSTIGHDDDDDCVELARIVDARL